MAASSMTANAISGTFGVALTTVGATSDLSVNGFPGLLWLTRQDRKDKDYALFGEASFDEHGNYASGWQSVFETIGAYLAPESMPSSW